MKMRIVFAVAAGAALCMASAANADFDVNITTTDNDPMDPYIEVVSFSDHTFNSSDTMDPFNNPDGAYPIHITSGTSTLAGWDYQMVIDYSDYDIGFFGMAALTNATIDIKNSAYAGVIDAIVLDTFNNAVGSVSFTDTTMMMQASGLLLQPTGVATVYWNVPAPGALALLAIAGVVGSTRRRT